MEILEFGNKEKDKIILIHGFESPYQIWEQYIEHYKNDYHIIVPILEGHNPNKKEEFKSFKDSSEKIENYYLSKYGNNVYAIYGMSMGGVLAANLWQNQKLKIEKIILESSPLLSYNKFISSILTKQYLKLTHKTKQRDKKVIKQATTSFIPKDKLNEFLELIDNITDNTIINYINEIAKYKLPNNINTSNTEIYYFYGTKLNELLAKKTAKYLKKHYPKSNIICLKGKGHCEDSIMNPHKMIKKLDKILKNRVIN